MKRSRLTEKTRRLAAVIELLGVYYPSGCNVLMVREGDRIAQGILAPVIRACFKECDDLSATVRGAAGFGSTGV